MCVCVDVCCTQLAIFVETQYIKDLIHSLPIFGKIKNHNIKLPQSAHVLYRAKSIEATENECNLAVSQNLFIPQTNDKEMVF